MKSSGSDVWLEVLLTARNLLLQFSSILAVLQVSS